MANNYHSFVLLFLSISITFSLLVNSAAETVSFKFNGFDRVQSNRNLILQGDAQISAGLALTKEQSYLNPVSGSVGRVLYETPIHIWDTQKDTLASFQSNFSFFIHAPDKTKAADGFAFFLAPVDTQPQYDKGELLGIFSDGSSSHETCTERVVAVEFDTYSDAFDPRGNHVGIDVNSIVSKKTVPWEFLKQGVTQVIHANISYDASTYSLTVSAGYSLGPFVTLTEQVDLREVLPSWVRVGFSAATGDRIDLVESHYVDTWSFYSELPDSSFVRSFKNTNLISNA